MAPTAHAVQDPGVTPTGGNNVLLRSGNLFDSGAQTIVLTVNCVGVMGKGIALEAKKRYPDLFEQYVEICDANALRLGRPVFVGRLLPPSFLLFPTKDHWRSVSRLLDIEAGLEYLAQQHRAWGITSLAVPPLGCGHGGLEWAVVGPALYRGLAQLDIRVYLYVPTGVSADSAQLDQLRAAVGSASALEAARRTSPPEIIAIVLALTHALRRRPRKPFGRVLMQKLGYFALAAGIPAPIGFVRRSFGPYSPEWHTQIRHLVNNGILVEHRAGSSEGFTYQPGPSLQEYAERIGDAVLPYQPAIERVGELLASFSPEQSELAATTHMVAVELMKASPARPVTDDVIVRGVQDWKRRRKTPFTSDRIAACVRWLRDKGWLPTAPE